MSENTNLDSMTTAQTTEAIDAIRKPNLKNISGLSVMRLLAPFHHACTRVLLRLPINARQLTILWFAISLISFIVTGVGVSWAFLVGALLYYAAIILDLSDGEIGRYQSRFMTPERDFITHVNGMYLDRVCHIVATPLWPLAITVGLYQMTGRWPILVAGTGMIVYQCVRRALPMLRAYLVEYFRENAADLLQQGMLDEYLQPSHDTSGVTTRLLDKINIWVGNGKRLNLIILLAAAVDCILAAVGETSNSVLYYAYFTCSVAAVLWLPFGLTRLMATNDLVSQVCREVGEHDNHDV